MIVGFIRRLLSYSLTLQSGQVLHINPGADIADWFINNGLTCNHLVAYTNCMVADEDKVFKALADPSRRKLLDRLFDKNGQSLNELCEQHDMSRQAVTKHLGLLEDANLVVTVKRGREKLHYLNPVPIQQISSRWIGKFEQQRLEALETLKLALEEKHNDQH